MAPTKNTKPSRTSGGQKTGRPKPLVHSPGLTKKQRRLGCGGHLKTKKSS